MANKGVEVTLMLATALGFYPFRSEDHRISWRGGLALIGFNSYIIGYFVVTLPSAYANLAAFRDYLMLVVNSLIVMNNLTITISLVVYRLDLAAFWNNLDQCDFLFVQNNMLCRPVRSTKAQLSDVVGLITVVVVVYGSSFLTSGRPFLFSVVCLLRIAAFRLVLMSLVDQIESRVERLNWHLIDLSRRFPAFLIPPTDLTNPFREFASVAGDRRKHFRSVDSCSKTLTSEKIRSLNGAHRRLTDAVHAFNNMFGLQTFITFSSIFASNGVSACSNLILFLYTDTPDKGPTFFLNFVRIIINMYCVVSFINKCDQLSYQGNKTGKLIHEILDEDYPESVVNELELFSFLLAFRTVKIHAAGVFNVEMKLLPSVVALVTPGMIFAYKCLKPSD